MIVGNSKVENFVTIPNSTLFLLWYCSLKQCEKKLMMWHGIWRQCEGSSYYRFCFDYIHFQLKPRGLEMIVVFLWLKLLKKWCNKHFNIGCDYYVFVLSFSLCVGDGCFVVFRMEVQMNLKVINKIKHGLW
jgi:hypothetical protein